MQAELRSIRFELRFISSGKESSVGPMPSGKKTNAHRMLKLTAYRISAIKCKHARFVAESNMLQFELNESHTHIHTHREAEG